MTVRISKYFQSLRKLFSKSGVGETSYIRLSPCGHLDITDTPIIWTAANSPVKINHRRLTEINPRYDELSLLTTLTCGPECVHSKGSWLQLKLLKNNKTVDNCYYCIKPWWEREEESEAIKSVVSLN